MNVRILRQCRLHVMGCDRRNRMRLVEGLGQLQPVVFSIDRNFAPCLSIETVQGGHVGYARLPLPGSKARAKQLFAALESARRNGAESDAARAWRVYQESRD